MKKVPMKNVVVKLPVRMIENIRKITERDLEQNFSLTVRKILAKGLNKVLN